MDVSQDSTAHAVMSGTSPPEGGPDDGSCPTEAGTPLAAPPGDRPRAVPLHLVNGWRWS